MSIKIKHYSLNIYSWYISLTCTYTCTTTNKSFDLHLLYKTIHVEVVLKLSFVIFWDMCLFQVSGHNDMLGLKVHEIMGR